MALPTLADLKGYLRVDGTAEDTVLTMILASATAKCAAYLERPFVAILMTFVDPAQTMVAYGRITELVIPMWPVHRGAPSPADPVIPAPVITDQDDAVVDAATYRVDSRSGRFIALTGDTFANGPYTISCYIGLSAFPEYSTAIEPVIAQAIMDTASDLYSNRSPGASMETAGGGASTQWRDPGPGGLPSRARTSLDPYKPLGIA
jgi:hypothetical protein